MRMIWKLWKTIQDWLEFLGSPRLNLLDALVFGIGLLALVVWRFDAWLCEIRFARGRKWLASLPGSQRMRTVPIEPTSGAEFEFAQSPSRIWACEKRTWTGRFYALYPLQHGSHRPQALMESKKWEEIYWAGKAVTEGHPQIEQSSLNVIPKLKSENPTAQRFTRGYTPS